MLTFRFEFCLHPLKLIIIHLNRNLVTYSNPHTFSKHNDKTFIYGKKLIIDITNEVRTFPHIVTGLTPFFPTFPGPNISF